MPSASFCLSIFPSVTLWSPNFHPSPLLSIPVCLSASQSLCPALPHPYLLFKDIEEPVPPLTLISRLQCSMAGKKLRPLSLSLGGPPPCTLPPTPKTACYCGANSHSRHHLIRLICCPRAGQSWRKPQWGTEQVCPCLLLALVLRLGLAH